MWLKTLHFQKQVISIPYLYNDFKIFFSIHCSPKLIWLLYLNQKYVCTSIWNLLNGKEEEIEVKVTIIKMDVMSQVFLMTFVFDSKCNFSFTQNSQNYFRSAKLTLWLSWSPYYCHFLHFAQQLILYTYKGLNGLYISFPNVR